MNNFNYSNLTKIKNCFSRSLYFSKNDSSLFSGELFPSEVRAFCKGLTRSFSCILIVVSLKFFPVLESNLTFYGAFYFFAGILLLSVPIVYFTVPETKDLGLEQIQNYFTKQRTIFYVDLDFDLQPGKEKGQDLNSQSDETEK